MIIDDQIRASAITFPVALFIILVQLPDLSKSASYGNIEAIINDLADLERGTFGLENVRH